MGWLALLHHNKKAQGLISLAGALSGGEPHLLPHESWDRLQDPHRLDLDKMHGGMDDIQPLVTLECDLLQCNL